MTKSKTRRVTLDAVCDEITVGHVGPMADKYLPEGIPFLRSQNVRPFKFDPNEIKYVSPEFHAKLKKSALKPNDVVVTRTGANVGQCCIVPKELPVANCADLVILRASRELDPHYLMYVLNSPHGRASIGGDLAGAAQLHFNVGSAKRMEVTLPDLPTQRKIAGILSAYDDLIENNLRRIKILEQMAQSLYREWFVHFRFPGHDTATFKDSELGRIPEGWAWRKVGNAFEIQGGGTPSTTNEEYWVDGDIQWYSPRDLTAEGTMFIEKSAARINELGLRKSAAKMFPAFSVMLTSRATIGAIAINTVPSCTNQGFITCLPNSEVPIYFLYQWLKANVETFILHASGATFKEISRGVFKGLDFLKPHAELVQRYQQAVSPIADQLLNLQRRNQTLRRTRDLLLPKLLNIKTP